MVEHQLHYLQQCGIQGLDSLTVDDYISVDNVMDSLTVDDYISVDNVMETTEEVTTSSIVAQIQARRGESVEEDSDEKDDNSDECACAKHIRGCIVLRQAPYILSE